jgi:DnaJ-class molecular chaperone
MDWLILVTVLALVVAYLWWDARDNCPVCRGRGHLYGDVFTPGGSCLDCAGTGLTPTARARARARALEVVNAANPVRLSLMDDAPHKPGRRIPEPCRTCDGEGTYTPPGGTATVYCPTCNADGRFTPGPWRSRTRGLAQDGMGP